MEMSGKVSLSGHRLLYVICMYDLRQFSYTEVMLDGAKDMCEAGLDVDVVLQTTVDMSPDMHEILQERLLCRRTNAAVPLTLDFYSPEIKLELSAMHRKYMFDRLNDYDLFMYAEDDMGVTVSLVAAYLSELRLLESAFPRMYDEDYEHPRYIPSFIRWELAGIQKHARKQNRKAEGASRVFWENFLEEYEVDLLQPKGHISEQLGPYVFQNNPHTAMWILTRQQMQWLDHKCNFNSTELVKGQNIIRRKPEKKKVEQFSIRVWMSSNCFRWCGLTRVIPLNRLEQLAVHHLPDKNFERKNRLGNTHAIITTAELHAHLFKLAEEKALLG